MSEAGQGGRHAGGRELSVELLEEGDLVAAAQCIAIDAEAFPYESAHFGKRSSSSVVWVAREREIELGKSRVLGFAAGEARNGRLELRGLAVDREFRRRGIGRRLLRATLAAARSHGIRLVALHVWQRNAPAIALYQSEGFSVLRRLPDFYPAAAFGPDRDAFEMVRAVA